MKNNKAFTLIELLAIIVILAIIAVITVPIILNIIENSKMGAATDSAYGYKDSVQKFYVSKLSESANSSLELEGTYTVTDGVLTGTGINEKVPVSGTVPSSGSLTYENGLFKNGCLTVGDYAVTFNTDGTTSTEKGECNVIPTIATCPGCVFAYTIDPWYYSGTPTTLTKSQYKENYEDVISESGKNHFLGLKLNASGTIERAFACGVENGTPFCIEGTTDGSKDSKNRNLLVKLYGEYDSDKEGGGGCFTNNNGNMDCVGDSLDAFSNSNGSVNVFGNIGCFVNNDGSMSCDPPWFG